MIAVKTQGRLGNQLFQYAFGFSTAKKLKVFFFIDFPNSKNYCLENYFELRRFETVKNNILKSVYNRVLTKFIKFKRIIQIGNDSIIEVIASTNKNCYQEGFFQSEIYFKDFKNQIIDLFEVKKKLKQEFIQLNSKIICNAPTLVIHFRGGDYFNFKPNNCSEPIVLPLAFYDKCMDLIPQISDYQIIWISDSIDYLKNYFGEKPNYYYSKQSEINDFQFLINADKLIISNSSFAWWGAYLNKKNAEVFAPKYWFSFKDKVEYPVGITFNKNWNWVDV